MEQFKAYSQKAEVNGQTILSIVNGMGAMKSLALKYLAQAGLKDIEPGSWYSQQSWLDAFSLVSQKVGKNTLKAIGKSIPESAKFPPEIQDIHSALASIDVAYSMNHRNGNIGFYRYSKISDTQAAVLCQNPYPSEFDEGIVEAMAEKFALANIRPKVVLDTNKETRRSGGKSCNFIVSW